MRLVIVGAAGRMGRMLLRAVAETPGFVLAGAIEPPGAPTVGQDAGILAGLPDLGVAVTDDPLPLFAAADGVIDFTAPVASVRFAGLAAQARIVHVCGTTGFSGADDDAMRAAARHAPIVKSGNMSLGVNLLAALTKRVGQVLDATYDVEIVEMHHRKKVDAPSGTALMLGHAAAAGRGVELGDRTIPPRDGHTGPRPPGDIGFATLRGGTVVGDHSVIFAGPGERVELVHKAEDRMIYARGALHAARWARGRKPGLYSMADVLGLADI